jgi:hypothetical protein
MKLIHLKTLLSVCASFFLSNCVSVKTSPEEPAKPKIEIVDTTPSWDGNEQNSGIIDYIKGEGWLITPRAAERYTALTKKYGNTFTPALSEGEGLVKKGDNYILNNEYIVKFAVMNRKLKNELK